MIRGNGITPSITITILMRNINAANYLSDCFPSLSFLPKIQTNAVKLRKKGETKQLTRFHTFKG